jgi:hypothetical protein
VTQPKGRRWSKSARRRVQIEICVRQGGGETLVEICAAPEMPDRDTVYRWLRDEPRFAQMYAAARRDLAHFYFEQAISIADETPATFKDEKGVVRMDPAAVHAQRLRVDTRKWAAAKLLPRVYGDQIAVTGADGAPLIPTETTDLLEAAKKIAFVLAAAEELAPGPIPEAAVEPAPVPLAPLALPAPGGLVLDRFDENGKVIHFPT